MASFPEVSNGSSVYGLGTKMPLPRAGYITLSVIMALASVTSVVLNTTVIAVTLRHKQLRQPLNFALVNLAVADLGTTLTGGLPSVVTNAVGSYIMGRVGCVLEGFCVALFGEYVLGHFQRNRIILEGIMSSSPLGVSRWASRTHNMALLIFNYVFHFISPNGKRYK